MPGYPGIFFIKLIASSKKQNNFILTINLFLYKQSFSHYFSDWQSKIIKNRCNLFLQPLLVNQALNQQRIGGCYDT